MKIGVNQRKCEEKKNAIKLWKLELSVNKIATDVLFVLCTKPIHMDTIYGFSVNKQMDNK